MSVYKKLKNFINKFVYFCYLREVESRTQSSSPRSRPRPRTQKKNSKPRPRTALPRTDPHEAKDRNARGQRQVPRTQAEGVLQKKDFKIFFQAIFAKKKVHQPNFSGNLKKNGLQKNLLDNLQNFNDSKNSAVLERRTKQFSRLEALRPKPKT